MRKAAEYYYYYYVLPNYVIRLIAYLYLGYWVMCKVRIHMYQLLVVKSTLMCQ